MMFYANTVVDIVQITADLAPNAQITSCSQRSVTTFTLLGVTLVVGFLISRGGHFIKEQITSQNGGSYDQRAYIGWNPIKAVMQETVDYIDWTRYGYLMWTLILLGIYIPMSHFRYCSDSIVPLTLAYFVGLMGLSASIIIFLHRKARQEQAQIAHTKKKQFDAFMES